MLKLHAFVFGLLISFCSCRQNPETDTKSNISSTVSSDTAKLAKLIDLSLFRPRAAKFKYTVVDNSGENQRLSVAGPSDYCLEAVLYFDSLTFRRLVGKKYADYDLTKYTEPGHDSPKLKKEEFNFEWLDKNVREELLRSDTSYHGDCDLYYGTAPHGGLWILDHKVLIRKTSQ
ncbi:MAG: hypothetical protein JST26_01770 [Bacteroidetes bacterium]|nr:hypothetical protein [Bacteroidota bacterium]